MTYVISKSGKSLMPCENVIARLLLKSGRAKVVRRCPFTIKLTYVSTEYVNELTLGMDAGSGTIGAAVSDGSGNILYASETEVRNDISKKMTRRRESRRNRRGRKIRYRKPRFRNRRNSKRRERYAPTVESKVQSHEREIRFIQSILPIKRIVIEGGKFDMALMNDPSIRNEKKIHWAYQKGAQYDFANVKAYVRDRDSYTCQICKGKSKDKKLHVHHIVFRSEGGSDAPSNLITLCETCHEALHNGKIQKKLKPQAQSLASATQMNIICTRLFRSHLDAIETFGYVTSENRLLHNLPKKHFIDASFIASGGELPIWKTDAVHLKKCVAKGDYQRTKGHRSEQPVAPKKVAGFRKFDKVKYRGGEYFIKGRMSTGYAILMNIRGETQVFSSPKTVKLSACKRTEARNTVLTKPIHLATYAVA